MNDNQLIRARWNRVLATQKADLPALTVARAQGVSPRVSRLRASLEDPGLRALGSGTSPRSPGRPETGTCGLPFGEALDPAF